jgi:hypothetical protein
MPAHKWSRGAVKALRLVEGNRKQDLAGALRAISDEPGGPQCTGRNESVRARIHVELWRNGWAGSAALKQAQLFAKSGLNADTDDFYTNWKMAYQLKYRARSGGWEHLTAALPFYARGLARLAADDPDNADARRSILIDRAETFIYLSQADIAVMEMRRAIEMSGGTVQPWHRWALAFALHQVGDYAESTSQLATYVDAAAADDMYCNDMRLIQAANMARGNDSEGAKAAIRAFRENRDKQKEPVWSISLELDRGAFPPDSPGEAHWSESLAMLDPEALPR